VEERKNKLRGEKQRNENQFHIFFIPLKFVSIGVTNNETLI